MTSLLWVDMSDFTAALLQDAVLASCRPHVDRGVSMVVGWERKWGTARRDTAQAL